MSATIDKSVSPSDKLLSVYGARPSRSRSARLWKKLARLDGVPLHGKEAENMAMQARHFNRIVFRIYERDAAQQAAPGKLAKEFWIVNADEEMLEELWVRAWNP